MAPKLILITREVLRSSEKAVPMSSDAVEHVMGAISGEEGIPIIELAVEQMRRAKRPKLTEGQDTEPPQGGPQLVKKSRSKKIKEVPEAAPENTDRGELDRDCSGTFEGATGGGGASNIESRKRKYVMG